jgi:hypothetical protein
MTTIGRFQTQRCAYFKKKPYLVCRCSFEHELARIVSRHYSICLARQAAAHKQTKKAVSNNRDRLSILSSSSIILKRTKKLLLLINITPHTCIQTIIILNSHFGVDQKTRSNELSSWILNVVNIYIYIYIYIHASQSVVEEEQQQ